MSQAAIQNQKVNNSGQPWLSSARWDILLIISPAFIASLVVILFHDLVDNYDYLPLWAWVSFVLLVDVAHVYSTLYRTYLDPEAFVKNRTLLVTAPFLCWLVGCLLYTMGSLVFWKALAYLAVFHFIRQQFGFMALYARREVEVFKKYRWLDGLAIYMATLYPLIYWHTHLPRNFNWFIEGDFFQSVPVMVSDIALFLYAVTAFAYLIKEAYLYRKTGTFNLPRNMIIAGTALTWFVGIVALNSDLAFTMTNVIAHGVPYIALIWLYHHKPKEEEEGKGAGYRVITLVRNLIVSHLPLFLLFLFLLAYIEEGIWDGFIWREHLSFFNMFRSLPALSDPALLALVIPLLALPQSTHYVLDGFIWRIKDRNSIWTA